MVKIEEKFGIVVMKIEEKKRRYSAKIEKRRYSAKIERNFKSEKLNVDNI